MYSSSSMCNTRYLKRICVDRIVMIFTMRLFRLPKALAWLRNMCVVSGWLLIRFEAGGRFSGACHVVLLYAAAVLSGRAAVCMCLVFEIAALPGWVWAHTRHSESCHDRVRSVSSRLGRFLSGLCHLLPLDISILFDWRGLLPYWLISAMWIMIKNFPCFAQTRVHWQVKYCISCGTCPRQALPCAKSEHIKSSTLIFSSCGWLWKAPRIDRFGFCQERGRSAVTLG